MNQSNEYLSEFPKLSHMFLYKGDELADFLTNFLGKMRSFLEEVDYYKEKHLMNQFYETNGFAATDDDAKRALLYEICNEIYHLYPTTDEERNEIIQMGKPTEWTDMMRIGWKPKY
jgi:hypothetical protein